MVSIPLSVALEATRLVGIALATPMRERKAMKSMMTLMMEAILEDSRVGRRAGERAVQVLWS